MTRVKLLTALFAIAAPVWVVGQQATTFTGGTPSAVDATAIRTTRLKFPKGSRSYWHTHTNGQLLMIEEGEGRTQVRGGKVQPMKPGQPWWTAAGVEHWHGASPDQDALQLTIYEGQVKWLEPVTYSAGPHPAEEIAPLESRRVFPRRRRTDKPRSLRRARLKPSRLRSPPMHRALARHAGAGARRRPLAPTRQAPTLIPGVLFSGSNDGALRAPTRRGRQRHLGIRHEPPIRDAQRRPRRRRRDPGSGSDHSRWDVVSELRVQAIILARPATCCWRLESSDHEEATSPAVRPHYRGRGDHRGVGIHRRNPSAWRRALRHSARAALSRQGLLEPIA